MTDKSKQPAKYVAIVGFGIGGGKAVKPGDEYKGGDTKMLSAAKRIAPADSDDAKRVLARIKRAEADRKAAEDAGKKAKPAKLPGA